MDTQSLDEQLHTLHAGRREREIQRQAAHCEGILAKISKGYGLTKRMQDKHVHRRITEHDCKFAIALRINGDRPPQIISDKGQKGEQRKGRKKGQQQKTRFCWVNILFTFGCDDQNIEWELFPELNSSFDVSQFKDYSLSRGYETLKDILSTHMAKCEAEDNDEEAGLASFLSDYLCYKVCKESRSECPNGWLDRWFEPTCYPYYEHVGEGQLFQAKFFNPLATAYNFSTDRFKHDGYDNIYIHLNLSRRRDDPSFYMRYSMKHNTIEVKYDRKYVGPRRVYDENELNEEMAIALIKGKLDELSSEELPSNERGIAHMFIQYLTIGKLSPEPMTKAAM